MVDTLSAARIRYGKRFVIPLAALFTGVQWATATRYAWRWPLLGDSTLMHYVVYLMQQGRAPYRDIVDMNMPGTYAFEWAAMRMIGPGAIAWRVWDCALLVVAALAMIGIAERKRWDVGVLAASVFALLHLEDGIPHAGQRDLLLAVLSLLGSSAVLTAFRCRRPVPWMAGAGALLGAAGTVKPTAFVFSLFLLVLVYTWCRIRGERARLLLAAFALGMTAPILTCLAFLLTKHSTHAFFWMTLHLIPLDRSLGQRPLRYFFGHALSPVQVIGYISALLWMILIAMGRADRSKNRRAGTMLRHVGALSFANKELVVALLGTVYGFLSYVVQGKGYPYHRYPFLAFFLLGWALLTDDALSRTDARHAPSLTLNVLAFAGLIYVACFVGPRSVLKVKGYDGTDRFTSMLSSDLRSLGDRALFNNVQCLDMSAGCVKTLWSLRLVESTSTLYEYTLLSPEASTTEQELRERFLSQLAKRPPRVIVVTDQDYLFGDQGYSKLDRWPRLQQYLASHYLLWADRKPKLTVKWEPRAVPAPGYRIYLHR